jgi:hypothetical protein
MLWQHYVFRRSAEALDMWDNLFERRRIRLLYIAGRGFDPRAEAVMRAFVDSVRGADTQVEDAELLLVSFTGYRLSQALKDQTAHNARVMEETFAPLGATSTLHVSTATSGEDDISATNALRLGTEALLQRITNQTDIVLDVSSLPRVVYLSLMTGLLQKLIPDKIAPGALYACC